MSMPERVRESRDPARRFITRQKGTGYSLVSGSCFTGRWRPGSGAVPAASGVAWVEQRQMVFRFSGEWADAHALEAAAYGSGGYVATHDRTGIVLGEHRRPEAAFVLNGAGLDGKEAGRKRSGRPSRTINTRYPLRQFGFGLTRLDADPPRGGLCLVFGAGCSVVFDRSR